MRTSFKTLLVSTRNPGKLREIRALLEDLEIEVRSTEDFLGAPDVEEDAETLQGNAAKKAKALLRHSGLPALADDTGLEVDALDGRPGVHSARFAGPEADDAQNRARLLALLEGAQNRSARFRTVMAFCDGKSTRFFEGVCEGQIAEAEAGNGGFGYDSLFIPQGHDLTFAQMDAEEKNAISHRARALRGFQAHMNGRR